MLLVDMLCLTHKISDRLDVGEEYSRLSSRNYANLTYLTTPRFLKIKKARAEYNLNMAAEKWFKLKTAN